MIIQLITPLMLATAPQMIDAACPVYDHGAQGVSGFASTKKEQIAYQSTQTFGGDGRPRDSDYD